MPKSLLMAKVKIKVFFETVENGIYKNGYMEISKRQFDKLVKQETKTLKSSAKKSIKEENTNGI